MVTTMNDAHERERALQPDESFIVQAPAGSGKTELLIQRFLMLLSAAKQPEEILAITFTKKAATEMRNRILQTLTKAAEGQMVDSEHAKKTAMLAKQVLARDAALQWHLLENPNRLKIQTIDSFNAYLTRQCPILSRFGGSPDITTNPERLYRATVTALLSHLEEDVPWADAIAELLKHCDNDLITVQELLVSMLQKRDQWLPYLTLDITDPTLRRQLETHLAEINQDLLEKCATLFPSEYRAEMVNLTCYAAHHLNQTESKSFTQCLNLQQFPNTALKDKIIWLHFIELLFTKDGEWRKRLYGFPAEGSSKNPQEKAELRAMKERMHTLIQQLQQQEKLKDALLELKLSPPYHYSDSQWKILQALIQVLKVAVAELKLIFREQGTIDYIENAEAALFALGTEESPTDITLALDYQIRHILMDEFQDTSSIQYRLLEKLTMGWQAHDGRTLFIVGDPMQSIYRFREAEVGLFIRARQSGIGPIRLTPLTLSVNFRSTSNIVQWINDHFRYVFPPRDHIQSGAVSYTKSVAYQQSEIAAQAVHYHPEEDASLAIVELIRQKKSAKPLETIAILVRSRSHSSAIMQALRQADIPYRAIDIDPLNTRPIIQDLFILTKALLYIADRLAWLALLRSPIAGLTLADLSILTDQQSLSSLWERVQDKSVIKSLSSTAQACIQRIVPILQAKLSERHRLPLRWWIESTWLLLGGPATAANQNDLKDTAAYFDLLEIMDQSGELSIIELEDRMQQLFATPNHAADHSLQIMTIHNAKGLEFDTVILPHLEKKSLDDGNPLLLWMDTVKEQADNALLLAPIRAVGQDPDLIYDFLKRQQKQKNQLEIARLLYVAVTRAKQELHLFFNVSGKEPANQSLLAPLWNTIKSSFVQSAQAAPLNHENNSTVTKPLQRLVSDWHNPLSEMANTQTSLHQAKTGFILPNKKSAQIGTVVHFILQKMGEQGILWWEKQSTDARKKYVLRQLQELTVFSGEYQTAIDAVLTAIENTINDPRGQWILLPHKQAAHELRITAYLKQKLHALIIDRTFVDENNIRWIIDYKTTQPEEMDITEFFKQETKKHREKLQLYAGALQQLDQRSLQIGLYFPLWRGWLTLMPEDLK